MGCYSDEMKHKSSKIVLIISVLTCLMGFLCAAYGYMATGADEIKEGLDIEVESSFGTPILAGGVLCIITGVLGLLTAKFKNPFFTAPFIALSFIIGLLLFIGALIAVAASTTDAEQKACAETIPDSEVTIAAKVKETYIEIVDQWVCSGTCPCDVKYKTLFEADGIFSQIRQHKSYREVSGDKVKNLMDPTGPEVQAKEYADYGKQMKADAQDFKQLTFKEDSGDTYDSFMKCFQAVLKTQTGYTDSKDNEYKKKVLDELAEGADKGFKEIEDKYECGSFCEPPLFYTTRSIADGPPKITCGQALIMQVTDNKGAFAVAGLSALILFVGGCGAFPLCTDFQGKK